MGDSGGYSAAGDSIMIADPGEVVREGEGRCVCERVGGPRLLTREGEREVPG
jgi:hypothetical protein